MNPRRPSPKQWTVKPGDLGAELLITRLLYPSLYPPLRGPQRWMEPRAFLLIPSSAPEVIPALSYPTDTSLSHLCGIPPSSLTCSPATLLHPSPVHCLLCRSWSSCSVPGPCYDGQIASACFCFLKLFVRCESPPNARAPHL